MAEKQSGVSISKWTWVAPAAAVAFVAAKAILHLPSSSPLVLALGGLFLGFTIAAAVYHAELIANRLGEPFGAIVLAIAVTVIEVALIVSIMHAAKNGSDVLARDTVYATVMIVLNGVVGVCLMAGGARHHEQSFETNAAAAALSVLGTLAFITLVLPNYTRALPGPVYEDSQILFVSSVSLILYAVFIFVQTIRHRDYFLTENADPNPDSHRVPSAPVARISVALLLLSLTAVVLLAKVISPWVENAVAAGNLPKAFVGVIVAAIVLMPEGISAIQAALANKVQNALNLALGSAIATIGLTVPIVSLFALTAGEPMTLGLPAEEMSLLVLTLIISTVTLATGRTTILQGAVHFVIFAVFLFLSAVP